MQLIASLLLMEAGVTIGVGNNEPSTLFVSLILVIVAERLLALS